MQFSKNSWHYKFNSMISSGYDTQSVRSLCPYFWFTVWNMIKGLMLVICIIVIVAVVLVSVNMVVAFVLGAFGIFYWGNFYDLSFFVVVMISSTAVIGSVIGVATGDMKVAPEYITKHFKASKTKTISKLAQPSLVKEYYKAWKDKVCPVIEWK